MDIFIIPGYGTPEDVFKSRIYNVYLKSVFDEIIKHPSSEKPLIIFSGGNTDMVPPYKKTEAGEMYKLFGKISGDSFNKFTYRLEKRSLSSLENQLYPKEIIDKEKIGHRRIYMFCEKSRVKRLKITADKIFGRIKIIGLEVPLGKIQQGDKKLIKEKEDLVSAYSLWALKSKDNLRKFRKTFVKKFEILRNTPEERRDEEIVKMWRNLVKTMGATNFQNFEGTTG